MSILSYIGGKFYTARHIVPLLDYSCKFCNCYIEPFFGAGHVFFRKQPHRVEIINDINNWLMNFYRVWRDDCQRLVEFLERIPYSRSQYVQWSKEWMEGNYGKDDFEQACRYFYLLRCGFSGKGMSWSWGYGFVKNCASSYHSAIRDLELFHKRIANAQIECKDFRDLLSPIASGRTKRVAIYADPPYIGFEHYYNSAFGESDHRDLASILNQLEDCYIVVSYYEHPLVDELYPATKWKRLEVLSVKHSYGFTRSSVRKSRPRAKELILYNFDIDTQEQTLWKQ